MNIMKSTLTISALMGLTACGGSNAPLTFDQIAEQGSTIALETIDLPFTDPSTLPTSGSATYDGFVGVEIENAFGVAGELEITQTSLAAATSAGVYSTWSAKTGSHTAANWILITRRSIAAQTQISNTPSRWT